MVASGTIEHALVVGADVMSSILDYTDRTTCVLFGDGAGAAVISPPRTGVRHPRLRGEIDGSGGPALCMPAGGSLRPASKQTVEEGLHYVKQDGQAVFRFAVREDRGDVRPAARAQQPAIADIDLFVSHQANRRIILSAAERLGFPPEKVVINIDELRKHHRRHDSARPGRRRARRAAEEGEPGAGHLRWRRVHRGGAAAALGDLTPTPLAARSQNLPTRPPGRNFLGRLDLHGFRVRVPRRHTVLQN